MLYLGLVFVLLGSICLARNTQRSTKEVAEQDGETTSEIYFTISCIGAIIGGLGLILSELAGH